MADLKSVYKVFHLIRLLDPLHPKSVEQLMRLLDVSKSQVYRYLDLLRQLGYPIKTDNKHRKSIQFVRTKHRNLENEELNFIQRLIQQHNSTKDRHLRESILQKLYKNLSLIPLVDALPGLHRNQILDLIRSAIDLNVCIIIKNYRSMSSGQRDRFVEPLEVTEDARYLIAWEKEKQRQGQFKIDRIEAVDLTEEPICSGHIPSPMDLFGLTGEQWFHVRLELSSLAHHLLLEEFPLSRFFVRSSGGRNIFDGQVRNWKGIGRFVLGLPGEIEILHPPEFKDFIEKKIQKF